MDLETAELTILGRIAVASNATLLCDLSDGAPRPDSGDHADRVVYKPCRGEAPLWDFPDGTLAGREVASYRVSEALGWGLVPETVLRDGPLGPGMVQRWIVDADTVEPGSSRGADGTLAPTYDQVELFGIDEVPDDYRPVLTTYIDDEATPNGIREVVLAHANTAQLLKLAVFDVVVNNADRKGGHVLTDVTGRVFGIDHGICLHTQPKLRTVLWGWAGEPIPPEVLGEVAALADSPPDLAGLITPDEERALRARARNLADRGTMPEPTTARPIPWPPF